MALNPSNSGNLEQLVLKGLKFQFDQTCSERREANTNFSGKVE